MSFPALIHGTEGEQFSTYTDKRWPLGTKMILQDGREYRFGQAAGTGIAVGKLCAATANGGNFDELAIPTAVAAGTRTFNITNGATTIAANDFEDGYVNVEDDTGEGHLYKIKSHGIEAAGSAAVEVTLANPGGVKVAFTTSTTVGLMTSPYKDVIIHPSPNVTALVGVTAAAVTADYYGWFQVRGPGSVLIDGTVVIGDSVMASDATDGAVEAFGLTEGTPNVEIAPIVGTVIEVAATTEHGHILLDVPGW